MDMRKIGRKILGLVAAIALYYVVHEGAHLVYALCAGVFRRIVFMFPGVQIQIDAARLSTFQMGMFNLVGAAATLVSAYVLCFFSKKIKRIRSNAVRAVFYYVTILFLLNDPVYLSLLCYLFGGGDMNGISLLLPEVAARIMFFSIGVLNAVIIVKIIFPAYKQAFAVHNPAAA